MEFTCAPSFLQLFEELQFQHFVSELWCVASDPPTNGTIGNRTDLCRQISEAGSTFLAEHPSGAIQQFSENLHAVFHRMHRSRAKGRGLWKI